MRRKSIQLFSSDSNRSLQYQGKCKLQVNRLSSMLIVEPEHEEYKIKSASFKCGFFMNENVLFVIAEQEMYDFALIFDEEERCKKVYDLIMGDKNPSDFREEMLLNRFLLPFCNTFTQPDDATIKLKTIVSQLIAKQEDEKEKNTTTMNNASNLSCTSDSAALSLNVPFDESDALSAARSYVHGKRRHSQLDSAHSSCDNRDIPQQPRTYQHIVHRKQYQLRHIKFGMYIRQRLFIFTNSAKTRCCHYSWSQNRKLYYCIGCEALGKDVTAICDKDENGFECVKMENKNHICSQLLFTPVIFTQILKKPDYEIVENSDTVAGMVLIIFAEGDKSRCWEFQADNSKASFFCCKCNTSAKLVNKNTRNEYVKLSNAIHACEYIPYEPNKYYQFDDLYHSTEFEIQVYKKNGKEKKRLIIFDKTDRSLCRVYYPHNNNNAFRCYACRAKGFQVTAKLLQNSNGEEYAMLSKTKHICKLRLYSEISKKEIILRQPDFELMDNTENGVKKIFIFDSTDRSLCYTFSFDKRSRQGYYCRGCKNKQNRHKHVKKVTAALYQDENGEYYVRMKDSKHACEPRKYEPNKYAKKHELQNCYDFLFFRRHIFLNSINVAIYHPEDQSLCYRLNYNKTYGFFQCNVCHTKRSSVVIRIEKDENGIEYFIHDYKKHVCQPTDVSSICAPNFVILKREEINFEKPEKKIPKKKLENDESKIIGG